MKKITNIKIINPGSPPDIDNDIATTYRENVVQHLAQVYGQNNVANIGIYGTYKAKKAFKDMCTIYSIPFSKANNISATIPFSTEEDLLKSFYDPESDLYQDGEDFRKETTGKEWKPVVDGALRMEGRVSSIGTHACGVIVSGKSLKESTPLQYVKKDGTYKLSTQWEYPYLEALGLMKIDILGLDTVSLIQATVNNCLKAGVDPDRVNMDRFTENGLVDEKTYELLGRGETVGIFQLSNPKVQEVCRNVKPETLEEVADITALYRPGPMDADAHNDYWKIKHGIIKAELPHPDFEGTIVEDILKETHLILTYQETVMRIANLGCGLSLSDADALRKAMGKKKKEVMDAFEPRFIQGGINTMGVSRQAMQALWDRIVPFSAYGFNKSHAISYAFMAVCCAYLKANFPREFMAAAINQKASKGKINDVGILIQEAERMGIKIRQVDINRSNIDIAPDYVENTNSIYLGLSTIKGMNTNMAESIVKARQDGLFTSIQDFIVRTNINVEDNIVKLNKKMFEALAYAGAFDSLGVTRKTCVCDFEDYVKHKTRQVKTVNKYGTDGLFNMNMLDDSIQDSGGEFFVNKQEYSFLEKTRLETYTTGMFVSKHPMENVSPLKHTIKNIIDHVNNTGGGFEKFTVRCCVGAVEKKSKNGFVRYLLTLNDKTGFINVTTSNLFNRGVSCRLDTQLLVDAWLKGKTVDKTITRSALKRFDVNPCTYQVEPVLGYVYDVSLYITKDGSVKVDSMIPVLLDDDGKTCQGLVLPTWKNQNSKERVQEYVDLFSDNPVTVPEQYRKTMLVTLIRDLVDVYVTQEIIEFIIKDTQHNIVPVQNRSFSWRFFRKQIPGLKINVDKIKENFVFPLFALDSSVSESIVDERLNMPAKRGRLVGESKTFFIKNMFMGDDITFP